LIIVSLVVEAVIETITRRFQGVVNATVAKGTFKHIGAESLFGFLSSSQRAAAVMPLIQLVKLNEHDPYAYLKDVLTLLPTQKNNAIDELLPHK
jgi:hypothetical protein